ncbi:type I restriction/modification system, specificity subunit [Arcobacter acticola]|uniref:Type I restriction/modification system, specificity subunit n=1 Tax=Arcobacter acticola TaxID=1849015 RepID=A0A6M8EG70_9BACT|nr:restriction endonuclease subunit S [Arcobacter acticola]QKE29610.1 type I restriction/modification system, specificity subunit [Arcobacter acticola]
MSELYQLPEGWEWKKLGDSSVCKLVMGQSPSSDTYNSDGKGMPFFQGKTEFGEMYPTVSKYCTAPKKIAEIGDILLSVRAPVGPTNISNIQCCIGRGLGAIRPSESNTLTNYLLYFFRNFELEISNKGKGSTFSAITKKELEDTNIPLPPLSEQQRIVSKLDLLFEKIDKSIALHQKNMDEANAFMGSVLNDVFGELEEKYEKFSINTVATIKGGKRVPKGYKLSEKPTPYPYLRVTDFKDYGTICTGKMLYLTKEVYELIKRYTITDKDLYITNVGNTIGKSGIIPSELNGANLTENAVKLVYKDKNNTSNKFMYYFTKSSIFLTQLESATMQMAVPKLAIMRLGEITLPFPNISIQQKVVKYLDEISEKIEKIKQAQKAKMDSLKALKASILDQAFKGEL